MSCGAVMTMAVGLTINLTISTNASNVNLRTLAGSPTLPARVIVTINPGVIVGGTSTSAPGFDVGTGWPAGTKLTIINNGIICGSGGAGGAGGPSTSSGVAPGSNGSPGGAAIWLRGNAVIIENNGIIGGGGGGGGGGASDGYRSPGTITDIPGGAGGAGHGYGQAAANGGSAPEYDSDPSGTFLGNLSGGAAGVDGSGGSNAQDNPDFGGAPGGGGGGFGGIGGAGGLTGFDLTNRPDWRTSGGAAGPAVIASGGSITWNPVGAVYGAVA